MSMAAELTLRDGRLHDIAIRPLYINSNAQPAIVSPEEPRFEEIRAYLQDISQQAELATRFKRRDDVIALEQA
jgi:hypothetical protein